MTHNIKSVTIYLCIIAAIFLSVLINPAFAQPATSEIPYVAFTESFYAPVGDTGFAISNNANNIFTCQGFGNCLLFRRDVNETIEFSGSNGNRANWSIDNSRLLAVDNDYFCTSDQEQYKLILFDTESGEVSRHCASQTIIFEDWSPIHPGKYYDGAIVDSNTFQKTPFSPATFSLSDINQYGGYGDVFWDLETALPIGSIFLKIEHDLHNPLISSQFQICALNGQGCASIIDTLSIAPVDVFDYKLHKNWILWGGRFSTTSNLIGLDNRPSEIADTVLYLTNFHTGITDEIFRFSSLGQSNTYVQKFAWSPDGKTIALGIGLIEYGPLPTLSPLGTPMPTPSYPPGVVLLHLKWPSSTE